jgi:HNH endonuclease
VTSLSYPKAKHSRLERPSLYKDYRAYRPFLQREFGRICVYCRFPESMSRPGSFGIDHYRPVSLFPDLESSYSNLFYCCNACNSRKRDYWPAEGTASRTFIPNPCDHSMWEHLKYERETVVAKSAAGTFTAERLDLNAPGIVGHRALILDSITSFEAERTASQGMLALIQKKRAEGKVSAEKAETDSTAVRDRLETIERHLQRLRGAT